MGSIGTQIHQGRDPEIGRQDIHAAGFNLGNVKNRIDEIKQMVGTRQHLVKVIRLLVRQHAFRLAPDDAGKADNGIERRAQLMTHIGEEGTLGLVGRLGGGTGFFKFLFVMPALGDIPVQADGEVASTYPGGSSVVFDDIFPSIRPDPGEYP